ncbi:thioesterase family protein [Rhizobium sp. CRIBSB]|nr:thioesterase family protein [Rhizobium sp. CRIBSB]
MTQSPTLPEALSLIPGPDGALLATMHGAFSNAPGGRPPEEGRPFGGLLAAQALEALRQGLNITSPLRTLNVQYLSTARYGRDVAFRPRMLRGGRSMAFCAVEAAQGERLILHATASFGVNTSGFAASSPLAAPPPPLDSLNAGRQVPRGFAPHFTDYVEYRFETGPHIMGGNGDGPAIERFWMRTRDGLPLDEPRLCYLLDAIYPPAFTILNPPPGGASVDLRFDILTDLTPALAPEGWAFFEFRMTDLNHGWTMDDVVVWGADGTPLALARQRRKLF